MTRLSHICKTRVIILQIINMNELDKIRTRKLLLSVSTLYSNIDSCIGDLVKARLNKDTELEGRAYLQMESLMVASAQELTCVMDFLNGLMRSYDSDDLVATMEMNAKLKEFGAQHRARMAMSEMETRNFHFTD